MAAAEPARAYIARVGLEKLLSTAVDAVVRARSERPCRDLALHLSAIDATGDASGGIPPVAIGTDAESPTRLQSRHVLSAEDLAQAAVAVGATVWTLPRVQSLISLFDLDGDGNIDGRELAEALDQVALLRQLLPSTEECEFEAAERAWAGDLEIAPPDKLRLAMSNAAIGRVGPLSVAQQRYTEQAEELRLLHATAVRQNAKKQHTTRIEMRLGLVAEQAKSASSALALALTKLEDTALMAASSIAPRLSRDCDGYEAALKQMSEAEPEVLEQISRRAAQLANRGRIKPGSEVRVVENGQLTRAMVRTAPTDADGEYEVSLWTQVSTVNQQAEEGFNTTRPRIRTRPRVQIYASDKQRQQLSQQCLKAVASRHALTGATDATPPSPPPTSQEFLMLLYADASRTIPQLRALATVVTQRATGVRATVAPLKGQVRACVKTQDKYSGDYSRLTDLARMTFECSRLSQLLQVLEVLTTAADFEILFIKDRLMGAFDSSQTGGYRDMLINLRSHRTGHVCEVQLTLSPLLKIKTSGGHAAYSFARMFLLFEEEINHYEGGLNAKVLRRISCGMLRSIECRFDDELAPLFDGLIEALSSPSCVLSSIELKGCNWPKGRTVGELLAPLTRAGTRMRKISLGDMANVCGELPADFFEACTLLTYLEIDRFPKLVGTIPKTIGKLWAVREIQMWGNNLEGSIPAEISGCVALETLGLSTNRLSGPVPEGIWKSMPNLSSLSLFQSTDELYISREGAEALKTRNQFKKLKLPSIRDA